MEKKMQHQKVSLFRDYYPRVLYVFIFLTVIRLFIDLYIRLLVVQFATVPYKDNLAWMPVVIPIFHFIYCVFLYYANKKTFEIIKKESFSLWMKHLGIDILLVALCLLLTVLYNNFIGKTNASLRGVEGPVTLFWCFYFKHFAIRRWYRYKETKMKVVE